MKELFGGILMGIGIIIAGASGLCSLVVLVSSGDYSGFGMIPAVLVFGGPPIALGVGMFYGGRALIRQAHSEAEDADHPD